MRDHSAPAVLSARNSSQVATLSTSLAVTAASAKKMPVSMVLIASSRLKPRSARPVMMLS
jgi:hypothetical protein